mgnify:CR=1 FL=1
MYFVFVHIWHTGFVDQSVFIGTKGFWGHKYICAWQIRMKIDMRKINYCYKARDGLKLHLARKRFNVHSSFLDIEMKF